MSREVVVFHVPPGSGLIGKQVRVALEDGGDGIERAGDPVVGLLGRFIGIRGLEPPHLNDEPLARLVDAFPFAAG